MSTYTRLKILTLTSLSSLLAASISSAQLRVDFSQTGSTPEAGFEGYFATHEVNDTFTTQTYSALGSTISITPIWADDDPAVVPPIDGTVGNTLTGAPAAKQLILRSEGTPSPALYQDWIGLDGRNALRDANPLKLVISGLPSGNFSLLSHHHDPQNQTGLIDITIDDSSGSSTTVGFDQSAGGGAAAVPAIYQASFSSDGVNDVVISYSNQAAANGVNSGANDFIIINGIEIDFDTDTDSDGMPNSYETANGLDPAVNDAAGDLDTDGINNLDEYLGADGTAGTGDETNPNDDDSDNDGLLDGAELNTHGTDPLLTDTDGDFFNDLDEVNGGTLGNDSSSFPVSNTGLFIDFSASGTAGQTGAIHDSNYLPYVAGDRVDGEVNQSVTFPTTAFGGSNPISLEVKFLSDDLVTPIPNTATRMIGRNNATANNYNGLNQDMIRDWIGVDTRIASGGNGPGADTVMEFAITGLPAGKYLYVSHHHDTGTENGDFSVSITDATRTNQTLFTKLWTTANQFDVDAADGAEKLPSTSNFIIQSSGPTTPIFVRYASQDSGVAAQGFIAVNGLEITPALDSDFDGIPNSVEDQIAGIDKNINDSSLDLDLDTVSNLEEYYQNTLVDGADTDNDTLDDGEEFAAGTSPFLQDTDGDGLTDAQELNTLSSDPLLTDTDGDTFSDLWEFLAGSTLNDPSSTPDEDLDGYSASREADDNDIMVFPSAGDNQLFVDFNSNQSSGGDSFGVDNPAESDAFNNQPGYSSYHANHESIDELVAATYNAFGAAITVTPKWPDSENIATTYQSIGRAAGNNGNWHGDQVLLLQDWIGVDTRISQSGNGPFDGTTGNKTRFQLALGNLPAFTYTWRSYHHDTENVHAGFLVEVSTDGGTNFTTIAGPNADMSFPGTDSTAGGNPGSPLVYSGAENGFIDPASLPSTVNLSFTANGTDDVIIQFTPYSETAVHRALFAVNGFELTGPFGPGGGVNITSASFDSAGNYTINFTGSPNTEYEVTKSLTLNNDFAPISLQDDTDGGGIGSFFIPAAFITDQKAFFRIEEYIE